MLDVVVDGGFELTGAAVNAAPDSSGITASGFPTGP
jgi:hypothetical protein